MYGEWTEDEVREGLAQGDTRLTYDDFVLFPDDGKRHESIDGVHYVTPCPSTRHQVLLGRLYFEIESCLRQHPGVGRAFLSPFDVLFTKWDVVEPDLLFVAAHQDEILTDKERPGAAGTGHRDRITEHTSPRRRHQTEAVRPRRRARVLARRS
jgi:hypothetical protein